jgi:type I restriction enzyme S subunit
MSGMTTTKLEKVATIYSGFAFRSKDLGYEGIPVIKIANIQGKRVLKKCADCLPTDLFEEKLRKYVLAPEDTLVAMTGAGSVGKVGKMHALDRRFLVNQRVGIIRPNKEAVEPQFLYYTLSQDHYETELYALGLGAGQPNVSGKQIGSLEIPLPDLPTQRKIAGILSTYDDLIENNMGRIRILDEMAQSLYREWFVHFRFPGHESTPMVDSPLGLIPEGWEVKKLGDTVDVNARSIRTNSAPDVIHYVDIKSVTEGSIDGLAAMDFSEAPSRARRIVAHGDVIWSTVRPNLRAFALIIDPVEDTIASTGFAVLSAKAIPFSYLYLATTTQEFTDFLVNQTSGSAYPAVNAGVFENAPFLVPPAEILKRFNAFAENSLLLQAQLRKRNDNLRQTRDLLLPKLLSGQMTLEVADSDAAETVARPAPTRPASLASARVAISSAAQRTVTASPAKPAPTQPSRTAARKTDSPPPIDEIDRTEVLCAIRKLFNDGGWRDRDTTLKELSAALGYRRLGPHIREVLSTDLLTAVRRGIITSEADEYALAFRSITELPRDVLKDRFITAIGRPWITRDDATRAFARSLGYARTGEQIDHTARSIINGLLREGRLESDGELIRKLR